MRFRVCNEKRPIGKATHKKRIIAGINHEICGRRMIMNNKTIIKVKNRGMFATLKNNAGILVVLLFLCILLTFLTDKFFTANNILSVLRQISINMYIAIGMSLVIILGGIDLSVGKIVAMTGTLTVGLQRDRKSVV